MGSVSMVNIQTTALSDMRSKIKDLWPLYSPNLLRSSNTSMKRFLECSKSWDTVATSPQKSESRRKVCRTLLIRLADYLRHLAN